MQKIKKYILTQLKNGTMDKNEAMGLLSEVQEMTKENDKDIAIIGLSARLPMADSVDEYWDNLIQGRRCFTSKPTSKLHTEKVLLNPHYAEFLGMDVPTNIDDLEGVVGAFVSGVDEFDYAFFNIAPHEASYIEPSQRIFMEIAWGAIEDAGYGVDQVSDSNVGIFVGKDHSNSMHYKEISKNDSAAVTGNWEGYLASRLSYAFNFRGPAMVVDTACSSGLVAVHEACLSLRNQECEMAIAGGIFVGGGGTKIDEDPDDEDLGSIGAVSSKDNNVRTFDRKTTGSVFGEGVVAFLLKPLAAALRDRDNVIAVIKGSAINNDGASNGVTAPNPVAQQEVIEKAWKDAGISPESVTYVEAHGTGTLLGDPIEVMGLTKAFAHNTKRKQFCGVGSVKTNVGHLVAASGPASLLKVALALKNEVIPPSLNFEEPNQNIDFMNSPLYVVDRLTPWKRSDEQRIAGINAFGFSGTNCHMVVAEAPEQAAEPSTKHAVNILTFSGKTESALQNLLRSYVKYLEAGNTPQFDDLCYTANIGRGHFTHRVAMMVKDHEDLRQKIQALIDSDFSAKGMEDVYSGHYRVVSARATERQEGDVTEKELHDLFVQASKIMQVLHDDERKTAEQLRKLAQVYVQGAHVDFFSLYSGETHYRVSLPTYCFDSTFCWTEPKTTKLTSEAGEALENTYPVVERKLIDSVDTTIYQTHFSTEKHWFLKEHRLMGTNIVPGTAYIEMMREIAKEYWNVEQVLIKSLVFSHPLEAGAEPVPAQFIITRQDQDDLLIRIATCDPEDHHAWTEHAQAVLSRLQEKPQEVFAVQNIAEQAEDVTITIPETSDSDDYIYMGPRWHSVLHTYKKGDTLESEIRLAPEFVKDVEQYRYHPAITDAALNIPLQIYIKNEMYLPLSYQNLKIYDRIPAHFYSRLEKTAGNIGSEILSFRVTLADEKGKILAEIDNYTTKKVGKFNNYVTNSYFGFDWNACGELRDSWPTVSMPKGNAIIFADRNGYAQALMALIGEGLQPYYVQFGEENKKISDHRYQIEGTEASYDWLLEDLQLDAVDHVFQMANLYDENDDTPKGDENALKRSLYQLFFFPRSLLRHGKGKTAFHLLTDHAYAVDEQDVQVNPFHTAFLSMIKTLAAEYTNFSFDAFDFAEKVEPEKLLSALMSEGDGLIHAVRHGKLYRCVLNMRNTNHLAEEELQWHKNGVYVITGGTGGLGLEVAKYLAEMGAGKICLLARRGVPEREMFDEIVEKNRNRRLVRIIEAVEAMEKLGAAVTIDAVDVSDAELMKEKFEEIRKENGRINGIVHCAGVAGDGFLYNKSDETFRSVISPKVLGVQNVLRNLGGDQPDFIVLFSSMQTAFGGPGQGDYTAANSFLDGIGESLQLKGKNVKTINWPGWSETGMALAYGVNDAVTLFRSLTTHKALVAFNFILHHKISNVIPGEMNYAFLDQAQGEMPFRISDRIEKKLNQFRRRAAKGTKESKARRYNPEELVIVGNNDNSYSKTETTVAHIYAAVLDLSEIDVYDNFNAMGGDSILAAEVLKQLNIQFDNRLNISDMYMYSTVDDMTKHIEEMEEESTGRNDASDGEKQ